jgi:Glycosyl hydrolases family 43
MKNSLILIALLQVFVSTAQTIKISNVVPRKDQKGDIVDAHDGNLMFFEGKFYWYGTAYGKTDGFSKANFFQVYSSSDLQSWKLEGPLLQNQTPGTYYRPKVIFNEQTRKYVLWYNWYPVLWEGRYGVAVADRPTGPFVVVNSEVKLSREKVGDFNLLLDGKDAFIVYNTIDGHRIFVEKLSADFTASSFETSTEITRGCEATSFFKRDSIYYLLTDRTCCFCGEGSGARIYTSTNPLHGYVYRGNLNRFPGEIKPGANDGSKNARAGVTINAKQYAEVQLPKRYPINSLKLTIAEQRFVSHCVWDAKGNVISNGAKPTIQIAYQNEKREWMEISPSAVTQSNLAIGTQTHVLQFPAFQTSRIKVFTTEISNNQALVLSEIEIMSTQQNVGAASNEAIVMEVKQNAEVLEGQELPVIIPAQQTYIAEIPTASGKKYLWMGDLWGSRPDGIKGHDFQYWSSPLQFDDKGNIFPLRWENEWTLKLK